MRATRSAALLAAGGLLAAVTAYEVVATAVPDRDPVHTSALPPAPPPTPAEQSEKSQLPLTLVVRRDNGSIRELQADGSGVPVPAATDNPPQIPEARPLEAQLADFERALRDSTNGQAEVFPELEGDELVGLHVGAIQEDSRFAEIGIEEGDVITQFNGVSLDSPFLALHALREMLDSDGYRVVVRRGDATMDLDRRSDGAGR